MIKFFRHIRQQLVMENKTSKYFKYAIGEIILVVIGILIALQINNWNETRKNRTIEQDYYCQLLNDFELDKAQILSLKAEAVKKIETGKQLIKHLHQKNKTKNELLTEYIYTVRGISYVPIDVTYTDLKSSGNINLLKNKNLKQSLINYYSNLESLNDKLIKNRDFRIEKLLKSWDNVLELGWQELAISKQLNLDSELLDILPKNNWHLDSSSIYYKRFQEVVFIGMSLSSRELELFDIILAELEPIKNELNSACYD
ncbi:hypothetical protein J4050_04995 [Winogradskyella sp. DF17]|uniref:Uncharacterized protein n=1 Tax=Winogradskyella pelagia TaxID=2819984 RepID=A0ABS3T023_9FLAO|nr:DUF6090 family protein [Winogradskyella sp. DF17]MBO3116091.1 hypothetical protein [Winogradskyella sp. DF17]